MILEDLKNYYGSYAKALRVLDLGSSTYQNWKKHGYIPILTQIRIEELTKGVFEADLSHSEPYLSKGITFKRSR